jgi:hypothetical protein
MKIVFELDDRLVPSIEQHLATQLKQEADPDTKAQRVVRLFADVPTFLEDVVHQTVHQLVQLYPPDHLREHFAAARRMQDEIKAAARPKRQAA